MKTLTLIVPCYNEEEALPPLFKRLADLKRAIAAEAAIDFLFVDDGSKDKTPEILKNIPSELEPARVVTHNPNQGLGAATRTGFREAQGEYVSIMDADCTYDPMYLVEMMRMMQPGIHVVTGSEFHPKGKVENITWFRLFLSRGMSWMYRIVFWSDLWSFSCLLRIYRREILPDIEPNSNGFLSCTESLLRAHKLGYRIVEFPLVLTERQQGESKLPVVRTMFEHIHFVLGSFFGSLSRETLQRRRA